MPICPSMRASEAPRQGGYLRGDGMYWLLRTHALEEWVRIHLAYWAGDHHAHEGASELAAVPSVGSPPGFALVKYICARRDWRAEGCSASMAGGIVRLTLRGRGHQNSYGLGGGRVSSCLDRIQGAGGL
jgi:hypothetical protein